MNMLVSSDTLAAIAAIIAAISCALTVYYSSIKPRKTIMSIEYEWGSMESPQGVIEPCIAKIRVTNLGYKTIYLYSVSLILPDAKTLRVLSCNDKPYVLQENECKILDACPNEYYFIDEDPLSSVSCFYGWPSEVFFADACRVRSIPVKNPLIGQRVIRKAYAVTSASKEVKVNVHEFCSYREASINDIYSSPFPGGNASRDGMENTEETSSYF